jgi:hypothetical protein
MPKPTWSAIAYSYLKYKGPIPPYVEVGYSLSKDLKNTFPRLGAPYPKLMI